MILRGRFAARARRLAPELGATSVEYALIAALIAAVIALTVGLLGGEVLAMFESVDF